MCDAVVFDSEEITRKHLVNNIRKIEMCNSVKDYNNLNADRIPLNTKGEIAVFIDLDAFPFEGIEFSRSLKDSNEKVKIVFLCTGEQYLKPALKVHASDYILKPYKAEQIEECFMNL